MLSRSVHRARDCARRTKAARLPSLASWHRTQSTSSGSPPHTASDTVNLLDELHALLQSYLLLEQAWPERIRLAKDNLLNSGRPASIAVVGERDTGVTQLVTTLLDDPLASDDRVALTLESRRLDSDAPEAILIRYGPEGKVEAGQVTVPSTWLDDIKAELVEIAHGAVAPLESSFSSLHLADLVILVLSDSTLLSSKAAQTTLYNLASKPNVLVALNCPDASPAASSSAFRSLEHQLETLLPPTEDGTSPRAVVISTEQAAAALEALEPTEPAHQPSYETFQKGYLASQIPQLHQLLSAAITATGPRSMPAGSSEPSPLQQQTAAYVLATALHRAAFAGATVADALKSASASLSALSQQTDEACLALLRDLGVSESKNGLVPVPEDELRSGMAALEDLLLHRLAWYKLPYRVDDLHAEIALVVEKTYLPRFEDSLVFASGRAAATFEELSAKTDKVLSSPMFAASPTASALAPAARLASLHSPTMLNHIAQASRDAAQSLASAPTALSSAVTRRRSQITAPGGPTDALQRRAQKAVVSSAVWSLFSAGGAIASELTHYAELGTNVGVGLLGVTLGAWGLQRGWEKAKKRFRKDVHERITGGLEEDLGVRVQRIAARAAWKSREAVRLGEELIRRRTEEWQRAREVLARIEQRRKKAQPVAHMQKQRRRGTGA
ncbi:hypothetical protein JCM10908_007266 [Rhodotorula pacifica]|uniref:uncharacterized protein n=1 Tax=Rhodotorula pacifica TaxID=1495444 RepID=UPI00316C062A